MKNRKKLKYIIRGISGMILGAAILFSVLFLVLSSSGRNKKRPAKIENPGGFVQAGGQNLYDEEGNLLLLKGVNLGNWFVQEYWMAVSDVGDYDTGVYTQQRALEAMRGNPNLTDTQMEELDQLYLDTYIQESDFEQIADLGMNCVRVNFTYRNLTDDEGNWKENAFDKLDWTLAMCEKYSLYAILDLHGAYGSQNQDIHSGDDSQYHLYDSEKNMQLTCDLWRKIAERYRDRTVVAAYDLLNETRSGVGGYTGKVQFDFYDRLYQVIRSVDGNHLLMMECFTFPIHGVSEKKYDWENVAYSYHIYNLSPFSQKMCMKFYKALHNLMGYDVPVIVGEWSCWDREQDWYDAMEYFEEEGWSYLSWTYKANKHFYQQENRSWGTEGWGIYELDMESVDLSAATFEEIAAAWGAVGTENAERSPVFEIYKKTK